MTAMPLWIDDYLERLGWAGPTLSGDTARGDDARAVLAALVVHHTGAIPFENINSFLHQPVDVSPDAVVEKLVHQQRGGYCFEQNILFKMVLEALGYRVDGLLARVLWVNPDPTTQNRTHMALKVTLDDTPTPVIVDVGFGGNVLTGVLDLVSEVAQTTPNGAFKLVERADGWLQMVEIGDVWRPTYLFTLEPHFQTDFELASWWVSTNPQSPFRSMLAAARALPDKRVALRNRQLSIHHADGTSTVEELSPAAAIACLSTHFGIKFAEQNALITRLEEIER